MKIGKLSSTSNLQITFDKDMVVPESIESVNYNGLFEIMVVSIIDGSSVKDKHTLEKIKRRTVAASKKRQLFSNDEIETLEVLKTK